MQTDNTVLTDMVKYTHILFVFLCLENKFENMYTPNLTSVIMGVQMNRN